MRIPDNLSIPSPFMGSYFCKIINHNAAFVAISKNAVTFLKKIAIYTSTGTIVEDQDEVHSIIGFTDESKYLFPVSKLKNLEAENGSHLKFAVWRDPVERLISTYKFFCLEREFRRYFQFLDLYNDNSFERFMQFVEFELSKSEAEHQDEHIRRQVDYYNPEDVDYIIPIHKLNQFLTEKHIPVIEEKSNTTSVKFDMRDKKWLETIKSLYKDDYLIPINY
jgi:hypothetical protein